MTKLQKPNASQWDIFIQPPRFSFEQTHTILMDIFLPNSPLHNKDVFAKIRWLCRRGTTETAQQPWPPKHYFNTTWRKRLQARRKTCPKMDPICSLLARAMLPKLATHLQMKKVGQQMYTRIDTIKCFPVLILLIIQVTIICTNSPFA